MMPLGFIYGVATFYGLRKMKKPLRKAAVETTSQMFNVVDHTKETAYNIKEGIEDIIAEAQYENLKRNQGIISSKLDLEAAEFDLEGGIEPSNNEENNTE